MSSCIVSPQILTCRQIQDCAVGFDRIAAACDHRASTVDPLHPCRWSQESQRYRALAQLLRTATLQKLIKSGQDPVLEINLMALQISGLIRRTEEIQRVSRGLTGLSQLAMALLSGGYELVALDEILCQIQIQLDLERSATDEVVHLGIPVVSLQHPFSPLDLSSFSSLTRGLQSNQ